MLQCQSPGSEPSSERTQGFQSEWSSQEASYLLTYLLTPWCRVLLEQLTGMQLIKKFPAISRNSKVHYRTHKRPPPVSILGQPNTFHIPTSHLLQIRPNIIHPSKPRSPQRSLSLRFPHQDPIHPTLLTHMRHMPSPSHSSRFYHPHSLSYTVDRKATCR